MPPTAPEHRQHRASWFRAIAQLLLGALCLALSFQIVLGDADSAGGLMSVPLWERMVSLLGGTVQRVAGGRLLADVPLISLFAAVLTAAAVCWVIGAAAISRRTTRTFSDALIDWAARGWLWWCLPGVWLVLWTMTLLAGSDGWQGFLLLTAPLWFAVTLAGWFATLLTMAHRDVSTEAFPSVKDDHRVAKSVWLAAGLYVLVYTAMNWQLYRGLLVPHGDSAMYEEHLWNVEHGRGFRSYLDPGLFLGEHIQVIHLALVPLHLLWPSHMLLELCESLALTSGAIAVFWIARRHAGDEKAGVLLAVAYLLYFPMQFLDIAVDLKTFRPISFGVPLMLFAIDRMERGKYWGMSVLLLLALTAKEDYSVVIAPLGLWLLFRGRAGGAERGATGVTNIPGIAEHPRDVSVPGAGAESRGTLAVSHGTRPVGFGTRPVCFGARPVCFGAGMFLFGVGYLLLVLLVLIPAFRAGNAPHYTGYFAWLGDSPAEIARTMIERPSLWLGRLFSGRSLFYALALLVPVGFIPLLSPGRLSVGLPLLAALCLLEVSGGHPGEGGLPLVPFHHFHAPLVPILFWAAAAGINNFAAVCNTVSTTDRASAPDTRSVRGTELDVQPDGSTAAERDAARFLWAVHFCWTSALATGLFYSLSPLGIPFWDFGSAWNWRKLYVPGERAEKFAGVVEMIPRSARVASTDFVHPRFTHYERAYDYSQYPRAVNDDKPGAPPDTEYIVIDTQHPYSHVKRPEEVPEFRDQPQQWELLRDDGFFIVLKRKNGQAR